MSQKIDSTADITSSLSSNKLKFWLTIVRALGVLVVTGLKQIETFENKKSSIIKLANTKDLALIISCCYKYDSFTMFPKGIKARSSALFNLIIN